MGVFKAKALKAALTGQLLTGLITNEITAELLL
jgi:DNA-binding transcriptional regulator LsrR (DeoR family)